MEQTKSTWTRSPNIRWSHRWVIMQYIALLLLTASLGVPDKTGLIDYITDLRDYITDLRDYITDLIDYITDLRDYITVLGLYFSV